MVNQWFKSNSQGSEEDILDLDNPHVLFDKFISESFILNKYY
jgi:hypothetical protein